MQGNPAKERPFFRILFLIVTPSFNFGEFEFFPFAVKWIDHEGEAGVSQVNPDLVRSSGKDLYANQAELVAEILHFLKDGKGVFSPVRNHHLARLPRIHRDGFIHFNFFIPRLPFHDGVVYFIHLPVLKLTVEFLVGFWCSGDDQAATGWFIQSVDGNNRVAKFRPEQVHYIGDIRDIAVGDGKQVSGLINDDQVIVLVQNF